MHSNNEILIDYLDKQLGPEESTQVESMVQNDIATASEFQYLNLAINTVRLNAINQKVSAIRQAFGKSQAAEKHAPAIVRSMYKISMRVAAIIILVIGLAVLYKYASVNNQSIYDQQFVGYELSNMRGQGTQDAEVEAYQGKNWNKVIAIHSAGNNKSNKSSFLAAMADMQLSNFPQAITLFENILNTNSGDNSFREEAEYYVSLAYMMNHEENKAIQMIGKIKADPTHTYYPLVSKISPIDLKIIELKK